MAKTPRLRYHGIECTPKELDELLAIAGGSWSPHVARQKIVTRSEGTWLPYDGHYIRETWKATCNEYPWAVKRGILKYDIIKKCYVWTALGAMYMRSVARGNPRLRRHGYTTAKFRRKKWRLEGLARKRGET